MKNLLKIIKILIFLLIPVFLNTVFGSSGEIEEIELNSATGGVELEFNLKEDQDKTIKELNSEVKQLDKERVTNTIKISRIKSSVNVTDFFKNNLSSEEMKNLRELIYEYNYQKNELDKQLEFKSEQLNQTDSIKKGLIENKEYIYKKLIPYIDKNKFNEYLEFIKSDVVALKESSEIKDSVIKKNTILKEKVENIKEKIIEHKQAINKKLQVIIVEKITEKINNFTINVKFQALSSRQKEELIKNIIFKADEQIEELSKIQNKTTILIQKMEIYSIVKKELEKILLEL